jgi:hypothetical protein
MGSHRFPLPWSPRSDSLDRCTSHEDRWSDFLRQRAKGGKRGFVLSVGGLPLWRAKLRAVAPHLKAFGGGGILNAVSIGEDHTHHLIGPLSHARAAASTMLRLFLVTQTK